MKQKLYDLVKGNTVNGKYDENQASALGKRLELSRNWISQYLNEFFNDGTFIKINSRPVLFLDKKTLEENYHIEIQDNLFNSFQDLLVILKGTMFRDFQKLIGCDRSLKELVDKCKAAISYPPNGIPCLLQGPTGSGKSFIVYLMYEYGINEGILKKDTKFIHVNCSEYTNNPELLTATLFGYKKGAFTGADQDHIGLIKAAEGGVLFLDEVHCLKPECQEKLFLFMDSGNYRMLGDNSNTYHSDVRLMFATTEDIQQVLLKTLLRRIPIRLDVPSLNDRGIHEKAQILVDAMEQEAKKIGRELWISNTAYVILINARYMGNVGELRNAVQTACMNALYHCHKDSRLEIHTLDLPEAIIRGAKIDQDIRLGKRHEMMRLSDILDRVKQQNMKKSLWTDLLDNLTDLQNNEYLMTDFITHCHKDMEAYYNLYLYEADNAETIKEDYVKKMMHKIVEMVGLKYHMDFQMIEIQMISSFVKDFSRHKLEMDEFHNQNRNEETDFSKLISTRYSREYAIALEMAQDIAIWIDLHLTDFMISVITLIMVLYHVDREINRRIGVIIAHGYATASSIANAANQMLGQYVFDAIDMPLNTTTEAIVNKLDEYLMNLGKFQDLVLLVDMGSLEKIYEGIADHMDADIAIANNVNTKMALNVGEGLRKDEPLSKIFQDVEKYNQNSYHIIQKVEKEKVILCSCATGIGTAEKLKDILLDSLPKNLHIKVLTYDYSTLLESKLENDFFRNYEVICIVGTLNPNIENIKFIPIEELIMNDSFDILTVYFKDMIDEADMEIFRRQILKNFSLSNIIGNLTILNPDKLLEHVAEAIDKLQQLLNEHFEYNTCFGLYVHICCLIERLVTKEDEIEYTKTLEECSGEEQRMIFQIKEAFGVVEKYYHVSLPIEEINYIIIYIRNFK